MNKSNESRNSRGYVPYVTLLCFLLFVVALAARMIELVRSGNWQDPEFQGMEEVTIAQNLAAGRGFITPVQPADRIIEQPSAYASPGYPYLLAIILKITGKISPDPILPYRIGFIINAIIGALAVVILAVSARGRFGWV